MASSQIIAKCQTKKKTKLKKSVHSCLNLLLVPPHVLAHDMGEVRILPFEIQEKRCVKKKSVLSHQGGGMHRWFCCCKEVILIGDEFLADTVKT